MGRGSGDAMYEVEHVELGRRFVLKVLRAELALRRGLVRRARADWQALGKLRHPNIALVTDAGVTQHGLPYFVMEQLSGETLRQRLDRPDLNGGAGDLEPARQVLQVAWHVHDRRTHPERHREAGALLRVALGEVGHRAGPCRRAVLVAAHRAAAGDAPALSTITANALTSSVIRMSVSVHGDRQFGNDCPTAPKRPMHFRRLTGW
jgi:hypothetical protein